MAQVQEAGNEGGIRIGSTLLTLVEPHRGQEVEYNRWYERDHFYAGCLMGAGWFAGKRWVATKPLKDLRFPSETQFLPDVSAGSYLATYWVLKGMEPEAVAWGSAQVKWLHENGRMFEGRDHIHTLIYANRWDISRDAEGVPAPLALDHPWGGLVVLMVDRNPDVDPRTSSAWLRDEIIPAAMADTPLGPHRRPVAHPAAQGGTGVPAAQPGRGEPDGPDVLHRHRPTRVLGRVRAGGAHHRGPRPGHRVLRGAVHPHHHGHRHLHRRVVLIEDLQQGGGLVGEGGA